MADDWSEFPEVPKSGDDWSEFPADNEKKSAPRMTGMASRERAVYGMGQGIAGMAVGLGQRVLPESVQQSRPFQAVKDWATAPSSDAALTGGRIVGPAFVGGPASKVIGAGAKLVPRAAATVGKVIKQFPRTAGTLTGATTAGLTTPFADTTNRSEAWKRSVWPAVTGGGLGGLAASVGRSPVTQKVLDYGVRLTPGRMLPGGKAVEGFVAHVPVLNQIIGKGWRTTRDDAQRALYNYAVQPLGIKVNPNHPIGEKGLQQLQTTIGNRYNAILSRAQFRPNPSFDTAVQGIRANNQATLSADAIRKFERVYADEVAGRLGNNNNLLTGQQLSGDGGVISKLRGRMQDAYKNQDNTLGDAYRNLATAIENHANFGAPNAKQAFVNARRAYARFSTLRNAAGRKADARGFIDPESVLAELKSGNKPGFPLGKTFGGGDLQRMAQNMYDAGVPTVGKGGEVAPLSVQDVGLAGLSTIAGAATGIHPSAEAALLSGAAGIPSSLLYTPAGMSGLADLARQNPAALGIGFGGSGGQAEQTFVGR